jgi:hypothetical protein
VQTRHAGAVNVRWPPVLDASRGKQSISTSSQTPGRREKKNILHAAATIENTSIHHKESNVLSYIFLPLIFDRLLVRI